MELTIGEWPQVELYTDFVERSCVFIDKPANLFRGSNEGPQLLCWNQACQMTERLRILPAPQGYVSLLKRALKGEIDDGTLEGNAL